MGANASAEQCRKIGSLVGDAARRFWVEADYAQHLIEQGGDFQDWVINLVLACFGNVFIDEGVGVNVAYKEVEMDYPAGWSMPLWQEQLKVHMQDYPELSITGLQRQAKSWLGKKDLWEKKWQFRARRGAQPGGKPSYYTMGEAAEIEARHLHDLKPGTAEYRKAERRMVRGMRDNTRIKQKFVLTKAPIWEGLIVFPLPGRVAEKYGLGNLWEDMEKPFWNRRGVWAKLFNKILWPKLADRISCANWFRKPFRSWQLTLDEEFAFWLRGLEKRVRGDFVCFPYNAGRLLAGYSPIVASKLARRQQAFTLPTWVNASLFLVSPTRMEGASLGIMNSAENCCTWFDQKARRFSGSRWPSDVPTISFYEKEGASIGSTQPFRADGKFGAPIIYVGG